jgi:hypothetical protein
MGRAKGFIVSEEVKEKARLTRLMNKEKKNTPIVPMDKPILKYTGYETEGFDFWESIRDTLRPLHKYTLCRDIEHEMVDPAWWNNPVKLRELLSKYFILEKIEGTPKKVRKIRIFTEEERKAIGERFRKHKEIKV